MCGICGIVGFNGQSVNGSSLRQMLKSMKHRGPDDQGIYINNNVGFGHVRLSIIDLSLAGHQPFSSKDNRYVLIYNGEIYNYIELRELLKSKGYSFFTNTDTEVLLNAYMEWGESCLDRFNGMWAFVIYDTVTNKIFGARDRYGVKPFYYFNDGTFFLFASDIPPILCQFNKKPLPNKQIVFDYLAFSRTDHTEQTFFESIKKIQHGHSFTLNTHTGEFRIKKWYNLPQRIKEPFTSSEDFLQALQSSIILRLRSDVSVGVCLSGGLDSSSIVSLLTSSLNQEKINTFSAVYRMNHRANEKEYIDLVDAKQKYFTYPTEDDFINDLPRLIHAQSEPFPSSAIYAQFKVMELAKKYVTVLLDGQGADEYLAGYHYYFGYYFFELLKNHQYLNFIKQITEHFKNYSLDIGIEYLLYLLAPRFLKELIIGDKISLLGRNTFRQYIKTTAVIDDLHKAKSVNEACFNHFEYKLEHLLKWEDRNSMFFSLESRVPFLDYNIVERMIAGPTDQKIHNGFTKAILRDAMKGRLNDSIRLRKDKVGFATPEDIWLRSEGFRKLCSEAISSKNGISYEFIESNNIDSNMKILLRDPRSSWKWINLYLWEKQFYFN
jgi:asparagine synthase (glutamine-hydrolysing)